MLFKQLFSVAIVASVLGQIQVHAQFYDNSGCSSCGTAPMPMAIAAQTTCTPIMPVQSTCYQTVPVTTYRTERKKVQEPYYVTDVQEQKVTVMRPVTRQRTVEVPVTTYQTVTENRTTQRDLGRWQTNYQPIAKCAPCQVDPRPGMIGWLNRTGYSFRSAFIPDYKTTRQYVPKMVVCNTPVTRQVAVQTMKRMVVNETEMVPETKVVKVNVQKLAYREREVEVSVPQTAYRTVPMGTTTAYGYGGGTMAYGYGAGTFAYGSPYGGQIARFVDDEEDSTRSARLPTDDPMFDDDGKPRAALNEDLDREKTFNRSSDDERFRRSSQSRTLPPSDGLAPAPAPTPAPSFPPDFGSIPRDSRIQPASYRPPADRRTTSRGWKASSHSADETRTASSGADARKTVSLND